MKYLKRWADNTTAGSLANKFRQKRFAWFVRKLDGLERPVRILDLGGTSNYWRQLEPQQLSGLEVVLLNLEAESFESPVVESLSGDARDLSRFADKQFDLVFSNSVIEHVGSLSDQQQMAREIARVGKSYVVQTPNYYFPIEPHFLVPFFQFLPFSVRIFLVKNFSLGWTSKVSSDEEAETLVNSVRLMDKEELVGAFPESKFYSEKCFGLTKSFVVFYGV